MQPAQEWERLATKLLKGRSIDSLSKRLLSGLNSDVVYTSRPSDFKTVVRKSERWDRLSCQGRVGGRFQKDVAWLQTNPSSTLSRLFMADDIGAVDADRIEILDVTLEQALQTLLHLGGSVLGGSVLGGSVLHLDVFTFGIHDDLTVNQIENATNMLSAQQGNHPLTIDASVIHDLGASASEELLWVLSSLAQLYRCGVVDWSTVWIQLSLDVDIFENVVKVRSLKQLMQGLRTQLKDVTGMPYISGETSLRMCSRVDQQNNMLRALYASIAGIWGGVDGLMIHGYDSITEISEQASRVAHNIHAVLEEESGLANWNDPLHGAYQIETQTEQLCTHVWQRFCQREEQGGMISDLSSGFWRDTLRDIQEKRCLEIASQRRLITGVTAFANVADRVGEQWIKGASTRFVRDTQAIEQIRATAERYAEVVVKVYCLGELAHYKPRLEFFQQFLAVVGWSAVQVETMSELNGDVVCLVGTEDAYADNIQLLQQFVRCGGETLLVGHGPQSEPAYHLIHKKTNIVETWNRILMSLPKRGEK